MRNQTASSRRLVGRFVLGVCLAGFLTVLADAGSATAQDNQGKFLTQASERLIKLVGKANADGFKFQDNGFSIGGGWLKQGKNNWVSIFTITLEEGKQYRFLAAGDNDAKDVDLQVLDPNDKVVASDTATDPQAVVNYRPTRTQKYVVQVRVYDSRDDLPCACLAIVMVK